MEPIVIIGSGMAGYTLAKEFRKLNAEQPVLMICADDGTNYSKPTLSNAFGHQKTPEQIALSDAKSMSEKLNITIKTNTWVKHIDTENHVLDLEHEAQSSQQKYHKLVLAIGANPLRLAISGNGADDIFVINNLNDYRAFHEHLKVQPEKRVLILGAGLIGCEFANDLVNTDHSVTVVDLAPQPLGRLLPEYIATIFAKNLEDEGVKFILGTTVDKINKFNGHYEVTLANGYRFVVDAVLSAIGLQPNIALAKLAGINTSRGVLTNALLETSAQDVYAMGDCAEVQGTLLPYVMPIMQQAKALANTLCGKQTHVHYPAMPVAVKTPSAPLTVLPAPADMDVTWETTEYDDGMLAKATDGKGVLRGFVLLGTTAAKQRLALAQQVPDLIPQHNTDD